MASQTSLDTGGDPAGSEPPGSEPVAQALAEPGRGRRARRPWQIPPPGWWDVMVRVFDYQLGRVQLDLVAAGVAFYGLLAMFPALAAGISIFALVMDADTLRAQIEPYLTLLPPEAAEALWSQLDDLIGGAGGTVTYGLVFGLLLTLYSAALGVKALMMALNAIYGERETRGFIPRNIFAYLLTLGVLLVVGVTLGLIVALPIALATLGVDPETAALAQRLRWPILAALVFCGLMIIYRYGPNRRPAKLRWLILGAALATVAWMAGSLGFSFYVSTFADYDATYGALGAAVVLMMWFFVSAFVVLLGAALNAEIEHQTAMDTTIGPEKPMGQRGACMADTIGVSATWRPLARLAKWRRERREERRR